MFINIFLSPISIEIVEDRVQYTYKNYLNIESFKEKSLSQKLEHIADIESRIFCIPVKKWKYVEDLIDSFTDEDLTDKEAVLRCKTLLEDTLERIS